MTEKLFPSREHAADLLKLQGFRLVSTNGREWRTKDDRIAARVVKHAEDSWDVEYFAN
ncbi:hypothetical protein [Bradyrhizobium sp. LTSP885]|uniref:hypothetical protein n=1 Tax=Bradyrhizobium sp. LTSP885 TaxID=1619232 RepID=UPI000A496AC8|nr:hypothetical protein [Bradyrhizobium sp. LTSP885]